MRKFLFLMLFALFLQNCGFIEKIKRTKQTNCPINNPKYFYKQAGTKPFKK